MEAIKSQLTTPVKNLPTAPKNIDKTIEKAEKEIKDGKKKLALTLGGLAAIGAAAIGIAIALKKNKEVSIKIPTAEEIIPKEPIATWKTVNETVKIKDNNFIFSKNPKAPKAKCAAHYVEDITTPKGINKTLGSYEYFDMDTPNPKVRYEVMYETPSGEEKLATRILDLNTGKSQLEKTNKTISENKGVIRKTNSFGYTSKNGKEYAKRTTRPNSDGSKTIFVDYTDGRKVQINIDKEGKRIGKPKLVNRRELLQM